MQWTKQQKSLFNCKMLQMYVLYNAVLDKKMSKLSMPLVPFPETLVAKNGKVLKEKLIQYNCTS